MANANKFVVIWKPKGKRVMLYQYTRVILAKAQLNRLRKDSGKRSGYIWDASRHRKVEPGYMSRENRRSHGTRR